MHSVDKQDNFHHYHQFCRIYINNTVLLSQMRQLFNQRNELSSRFVKLEKKGDQINKGVKCQDDRKKRYRRTAGEIQRHYRCEVETCQKSYGSEGSLNQHIKIKHPELYIELGLGNALGENSLYESMRDSSLM